MVWKAADAQPASEDDESELIDDVPVEQEPATSQKQKKRGRQAGDELFSKPKLDPKTGSYPGAHRLIATQANADLQDGGLWWARQHKSDPSPSEFAAFSAWQRPCLLGSGVRWQRAKGGRSRRC